MQATDGPHGSPSDAEHRPETRGACHRAALRADPVALLTMRVMQ